MFLSYNLLIMKKLFLICLLLSIFALAQSYAMGRKPDMPDRLNAKFKTNKGEFTCVLYGKEAPITVANFVGLAQGSKEWLNPKTAEKTSEPLYSGTIFHRVIPKFMIQGGDPLGIGVGGPGYNFEDEIVEELTFEEPGILAMANSGPGTNGSQFFVTVAPTPWLNGRHTIFGKVTDGYDVVEEISNVKTASQDKPVEPVIIEEITISEVKN